MVGESVRRLSDKTKNKQSPSLATPTLDVCGVLARRFSMVQYRQRNKADLDFDAIPPLTLAGLLEKLWWRGKEPEGEGEKKLR